MEQQGYRTTPELPPQLFHGTADEWPVAAHADWRRELRKAILSQVVPRLSDAGRDAASPAPAASVTAAHLTRFSDMVLAAAVPDLIRYIDALRAEGLSIEALALQLLTPTARRLGDLWLGDRLSFLDVTAGLGRLQGVMRALGPDFDAEAPGRMPGRKVLLAPVSGEQHLFGLSIVAAFFRRAGWDVAFEPRIAFEDLLARVKAERFTAIGLSAAGDRFLPALPAQIRALRHASLNGAVAVLAGGPAFLADPDLHERVGADAVATDAAEAVRMAEALSVRAAAPPARF